MIPLPQDMPSEDADQWLRSGVFIALGVPYFYSHLDVTGTDERGYNVVGTRVEDGYIVVSPRADVCVVWPKCGAINLEKHALYVQRRQVRQYRRTYNERCVTSHTLGAWDLARADISVSEVSPMSSEVVLQLLNPWYPSSLEEAASGERASVALSPVLTWFPSSGVLFHRLERVGTLTNYGEFNSEASHAITCRVNKLIGGIL